MFGPKGAFDLSVGRLPDDQKLQRSALYGSDSPPPTSMVDYADKAIRASSGTSQLKIVEAEVFDTQRRVHLLHRFIRHDLVLSKPMFDAISNILANEWGFLDEPRSKTLTSLPSARQALLILEDIDQNILSNVQSPGAEDRPGSGVIDVLSVHSTSSLTLAQFDDDQAGCFRLTEQKR